MTAQSGLFEVETAHGQVTAQLRGRLEELESSTDLIALGDRVKVRLLDHGKAVIEDVAERTRVLSRQMPSRDREQIMVANPDQVFFVMACADPPPNPRMLDRLLVAAEREGIPAMICANKVDLVDESDCRAVFDRYQPIGYPVLYTSAKRGHGLDLIRDRLKDRISVFAGPSGVGKTSLLNAIQPGLALRTGEVREGNPHREAHHRFPEIGAPGVGRLHRRHARSEGVRPMGHRARGVGRILPRDTGPCGRLCLQQLQPSA